MTAVVINFLDSIFKIFTTGMYLPIRSNTLNIAIKTRAYLKQMELSSINQLLNRNRKWREDFLCTYQVPKLCDHVSSDKKPGKIDSVSTYIRNKSSA
jgi:hypothetical protein